MSFDELLDRACTAAHLPDMARIQLPSALSDETKMALLKLSPEEAGRILAKAIEEINQGSIDSINVLVTKELRK